jgi:hypothetical protein
MHQLLRGDEITNNDPLLPRQYRKASYELYSVLYPEEIIKTIHPFANVMAFLAEQSANAMANAFIESLPSRSVNYLHLSTSGNR